ncbi:unnamed protein product [Linum tenue]|uniref:Uncharacterized protein n=1 Tax=Linum tenue TaxID=586396 RepID=A0AAV0HII4_9ROSI|nr:unnamed protein product [Linum tenue]
MMMKKAIILPSSLLLLLLLITPKFSLAVPATRSFIMDKITAKEETPSSSTPTIHVLEGGKWVEVVLREEEGGEDIGSYDLEGRMDREEFTDYPGTGANNHHDPKTPGRA